jgi:hypothetical protein
MDLREALRARLSDRLDAAAEHSPVAVAASPAACTPAPSPRRYATPVATPSPEKAYGLVLTTPYRGLAVQRVMACCPNTSP